jgi:hypothetical protein
MSSLAYTQFDFSLVRKKVTLFAVVDIGASGAATLKQWTPPAAAVAGAYSDAQTTPANAYSPAGTQGVATVTKEATAGQYTFTFQGSFTRLLGARHTCLVPTTGLPAAPILGVVGVTPGVASAPGTITVQLAAPQVTTAQFGTGTDATLGSVATNPANGERIIFEFVLDDSSAI